MHIHDGYQSKPTMVEIRKSINKKEKIHQIHDTTTQQLKYLSDISKLTYAFDFTGMDSALRMLQPSIEIEYAWM